MKSLFLVLLIANLTAGAWLLLQEPVGVVREPGRMDLQIEQGRVRILGEAEVSKAKQKADSDAAASAAAATAAATASGGTPATPATPAPTAPTATPQDAGAAPMEVPLASCIDIGPFTSEAAMRRIRTRLATAGLTDHLSTSTTDKVTRLRITGVDAAGETQIHLILKDFARQALSHCSENPAAR
jgi:cell division septation protein DedD